VVVGHIVGGRDGFDHGYFPPQRETQQTGDLLCLRGDTTAEGRAISAAVPS